MDSIQFLNDLQIRPYRETIEILNEVHHRSSWIIDGYGPLDILEKRFEVCDQIIFLDPPVWKNYLFFVYRQIKNIFYPRAELHITCSEVSFHHTIKLLKTIHQMHSKLRPELIRILQRPENKKKLTLKS